MKYLYSFQVLVCLLLIAPAAIGAEVLYVQSAKAAVLVQPQFSADKLAILAKGTAVEVIKKTATWTQISHAGKSGWVASMLLATNRPMQKTRLKQEDKHAAQKARKRATIQATAAATRGLSNQFRQRSLEPLEANHKAVNTMESYQVEEQEVDEFHQALTQE